MTLSSSRGARTRNLSMDGPFDGSGSPWGTGCACAREISILEAFWRSEHRALLDSAPQSGDILHTNAIVRLNGERSNEIPAFRAGNLLLCVPRLNALAILDPEREEIVWTLVGLFRFQHTPTLVASNRLLHMDTQ